MDNTAQLQSLQTQIDSLNESVKTKIATPPNIRVAPDPTYLPQGNGSNLNADKVDGINASYKPMPNTLIPLGKNGQFPVGVIPTSGGGGSGFLLGNGAPTDKNILIADGSLWQSRAASGDVTITADTGTFTLANTAVTASTYGDSTHVGRFTVDSKGRLTSASSVAISFPSASPGGNSGDIQFNSGGTFAGNDHLYWDNTNFQLSVDRSATNTAPNGVLTVIGESATYEIGLLVMDGAGTPDTSSFFDVITTSYQNSSPFPPLYLFHDLTSNQNAGQRLLEVISVFPYNGTILTTTAAGFVGIRKINPSQALDVNGTVLATLFSGSGASLTNLNGSNVASGTVGVTVGGTGTSTQFTQGSIVFAGASGVYSQDNAKFFWDDTNFRLGVGNASPSYALDVTGSIHYSGDLRVSGDTTGGGTVVGLGTNCPASTLTAPYTWVKVISSDGSTVYMPAYK